MYLSHGPALAKVPNQDHVARLRPAGERELTAVAREVEPEDLIGLEVGQPYRLPYVLSNLKRRRPMKSLKKEP